MNINEIAKDIQERAFDIPFGNSDFQENVHTQGSLTPGREYRHLLLQCNKYVKAIKHNEFQHRRKRLDIEEAKEKLSKLSPESDYHEYNRILIDLEEFEFEEGNLKHLLADALHSLNNVYSQLKSCHKYTREEFELEEEIHYRLKFKNDLEGKVGAAGHLHTLNAGANQLEDFKQNKHLLLPENLTETVYGK